MNSGLDLFFSFFAVSLQSADTLEKVLHRVGPQKSKTLGCGFESACGLARLVSQNAKPNAKEYVSSAGWET